MRALRPARADAERAHQRPKVESFDDFYYIVFRTARTDARRERVEFGEVHVFLGPGFAIAVRHGDTGDLTGARQRLEQRPALLKSGPAAVVRGILDIVVDDYEPVVEEIENDIEAVEHTIFAGHADATKRIHELKQEVNNLYRAVHPLLVPLDAWSTARSRTWTPGCCATSATWRPPAADPRRGARATRAAQQRVRGQRRPDRRAPERDQRAPERDRQTAHHRGHCVPASELRRRILRPDFGWMVAHIDSLTAFKALAIGSLALSCAALFIWFRRGGFV